jgi:hypothetical protein
MPGMMPPMSMANGIGGGSAGTPIPGTSGKGGNGGAPAKPKPGTVAAALQEKKESEKTRGSDAGGSGASGSVHEEGPSAGGADDKGSSGGGVDTEEEEVRRGLTSEERVLLREKKKERLMKEVETESGVGADTEGAGLNLSVSSSRHSDHPSSTKLEALLNKPIDPPSPSSTGANMASTPTVTVADDDRPLNNGDVTPPPSGDSV